MFRTTVESLLYERKIKQIEQQLRVLHDQRELIESEINYYKEILSNYHYRIIVLNKRK